MAEVEGLNLALRDYQAEAVRAALRHRFGTFVMGTGAGKTLTIAYIVHNLLKSGAVKRCLILVPDNGLVTQFRDELLDQYGVPYKLALFYDKFNTVDPDAQITVANRPLFLSRFDENRKFFVEGVDCLMVDEAHSIKRGNKVSKCIEKMRAPYRFGFTGTLAEAREDRLKNLGTLGPVRYEITSKELRDEGFLADVTVHMVRLRYGEHFAMHRYQEEIEFLQLYIPRNTFLTRLAFKLKNNTLVLVNFLKHGFELERLFNEQNMFLAESQRKRVYFIRGEVENDVRDEIKRLMEREDNVVCIAITKIFSTGINIKNLHHVVLAAGGKSSVTVVQSIGRGLRLHPNKRELNIWDISDERYTYSVRHAERRREIYAKERIRVEDHAIDVGGAKRT